MLKSCSIAQFTSHKSGAFLDPQKAIYKEKYHLKKPGQLYDLKELQDPFSSEKILTQCVEHGQDPLKCRYRFVHLAHLERKNQINML